MITTIVKRFLYATAATGLACVIFPTTPASAQSQCSDPTFQAALCDSIKQSHDMMVQHLADIRADKSHCDQRPNFPTGPGECLGELPPPKCPHEDSFMSMFNEAQQLCQEPPPAEEKTTTITDELKEQETDQSSEQPGVLMSQEASPEQPPEPEPVAPKPEGPKPPEPKKKEALKKDKPKPKPKPDPKKFKKAIPKIRGYGGPGGGGRGPGPGGDAPMLSQDVMDTIRSAPRATGGSGDCLASITFKVTADNIGHDMFAQFFYVHPFQTPTNRSDFSPYDAGIQERYWKKGHKFTLQGQGRDLHLSYSYYELGPEPEILDLGPRGSWRLAHNGIIDVNRVAPGRSGQFPGLEVISYQKRDCLCIKKMVFKNRLTDFESIKVRLKTKTEKLGLDPYQKFVYTGSAKCLRFTARGKQTVGEGLLKSFGSQTREICGKNLYENVSAAVYGFPIESFDVGACAKGSDRSRLTLLPKDPGAPKSDRDYLLEAIERQKRQAKPKQGPETSQTRSVPQKGSGKPRKPSTSGAKASIGQANDADATGSSRSSAISKPAMPTPGPGTSYKPLPSSGSTQPPSHSKYSSTPSTTSSSSIDQSGGSPEQPRVPASSPGVSSSYPGAAPPQRPAFGGSDGTAPPPPIVNSRPPVNPYPQGSAPSGSFPSATNQTQVPSDRGYTQTAPVQPSTQQGTSKGPIPDIPKYQPATPRTFGGYGSGESKPMIPKDLRDRIRSFPRRE